ncbi:hypothetical protein EXIGLDRAFT_774889 [Exidia glandulosa HHB12029]|uniref:Uncharacterized protein n=1 Tax=Exidia glandulosa HHB12029 TaxID=1314781 RepID=A0A165ZW86_EXIGL|nr:hypothetical protein EXIGLDRAFT_774889 [Exidia glandulosa HHB12029]
MVTQTLGPEKWAPLPGGSDGFGAPRSPSQPTLLSTPFTTHSPFEYPFTTSPPSPALPQDNHYNWQAQRGTLSSKIAFSPVPPTLLTTKGQQRAKLAVQDGGPVGADTAHRDREGSTASQSA